MKAFLYLGLAAVGAGAILYLGYQITGEIIAVATEAKVGR